MNSSLQSALELATMGFHIFPIASGRKDPPALDGWQEKATRDPEQIKKWWKRNPNFNIGISTSKFGDDQALVAVDVDNKGEKHGDEEIKKLEKEGLNFPETFSQLTPTGGRHLIYRVPKPLKQGVSVLGPGLDIRSRGGYVVGAGSSIQGRVYSSSGSHIESAPEWLVSRLGSGTERKPVESAIDPKVDRPRAQSRAIEYLENAAPLAVEGSGGDQTTFVVACKVKDFGVDQETCFQLLSKHWNDRCSPPWDQEDLYTKVENAYKHGSDPVGISAPELQFTPVVLEKNEKPLNPIEKFNQQYAYIGGSKGFVLHETTDEEGKFAIEYIDVSTFHLNEISKTINYGNKVTPVSKLWISSPQRRSYRDFCFQPGKEPPKGFYNLWRGFSITPLEPHEVPTPQHEDALMAFLEHTEKNVCGGDHALYNWLMGWFAHLFQNPCEKPLSCVVFRGGKGVGKNALIERIGDMLGTHSLVVSDPRYLTGNFNGHLENKLLVVLDEAFWSGDKKANGVLKSLITGKNHVIERKGQESYTVKNITRIAILGNEEWLVPASEDERRYAVFDVGPGRKKDKKFFKDMRVGMENGGYRLFLRYLLDLDFKDIDVDFAPDTEALLDQKIRGLEPFARWWLDCLIEGKIIHSDFGNDWPAVLEKDRFRQAFRRYADDRKLGTWLPSNEVIGKMLKKYCPQSGLNVRKRTDEGERKWFYNFPHLPAARQDFEEFIGHKMPWETTDEEEELFS